MYVHKTIFLCKYELIYLEAGSIRVNSGIVSTWMIKQVGCVHLQDGHVRVHVKE